MSIDLDKLTSAQLAALIAQASALLAQRLGDSASPAVSAPAPRAAPAAPLIPMPDDDDKDFVLYIKALLQKRQYIKADERKRVAAIAAQFPDWVRRQGLPADSGTGSWRNAKEYIGGARAKER